MNYNHLVWCAHKCFASVSHSVYVVAHRHDSAVQIKLTIIVSGLLQSGEVKPQPSQGLVVLGSRRDAEHLATYKESRLIGTALEDQPAQLRQVLAGLTVVSVNRTTASEGFLIQLNKLESNAAENHGTQTPVAQGQSLAPGVLLVGPVRLGRPPGILALIPAWDRSRHHSFML